MNVPAHDTLEAVLREDWGRLTSLLLAQFRRLDLVEDALGDAVEAAARRWPQDGSPDNPPAWLLTTARRRILDRLRAESMVNRKVPLLVTDAEQRQEHGPAAMADPGGLVEDERLRLVLMCTHPALAPEAASALALRLVLGVSTHDIARLFLVPEPTAAGGQPPPTQQKLGGRGPSAGARAARRRPPRPARPP
ncbi:MAG: sigma factor, partial [Nocardioides sp.]